MKIIHYADVQVKNREKNLYLPYLNTLKQIENHIETEKAEIVIIPGDFWEYATPTDSERKLIYNHFSRLLNIITLKEIVIIAGNHDLLKERKETETTIGNNPINVFVDLLRNLDAEQSAKIIYANKSKIYPSVFSDKIQYIAYSLEDNMQFEEELNIDSNKLPICLFHGMLKEYVDSVKLPLRKDVYEKLMSVELFPQNSFIPSGDIHIDLRFDGLDGQLFIYPGSTTQHTHNEGSFVKICDEIEIQKAADDKSIKLYELNDSLEKFTIEDIKISSLSLNHTVSYITLELDNKVSFDILKIIIAEFFEKFEKADWNQTFIKIKSFNAFLKYELEIKTIIYDFFHSIKAKQPSIAFEYDKMTTNIAGVNNKVIQEILNEKEVENNVNPSEENVLGDIDSLILSDVHLHKLFGSVLDTSLKNIEDSDISNQELSADIRALFEKELSLLNINSKRYNIELESIETNGFMALKENVIPLNIPGITRILGTNGIGKTTLYNMLRWGITGEVFPGMSKASAMKNNLIIFNKHKFDVDVVSVITKMHVNNLKVVLTRTAERKWKNNATDEQKISLKWKNFVSTIDRTFKVEITTAEGIVKTFIGDKAESSVLLWFGETLDNILFMNQSKLENLLYSASSKLNELVLNFVGVDYIDKLENNLDNVKTELSEVKKPIKAKDALEMDITDAKIAIKRIENEMVEQIENLEKLSQDVKEEKTSENRINTELIAIGNIPNEIAKQTKEKTDLENFLNTFEQKEKLVKIPFNEIKPILDSVEIKRLEYDVTITSEGITDAQKVISEKKELNRLLLQDELELIVNDAKYEIGVKLNIEENKKLQTLSAKKTSFEKVTNYLDETIEKFKTKQETVEKQFLTDQLLFQTNEETIEKNLNSISSGFCEKCKRPFEESFDLHKTQLEANNLELIEINKTLVPKIAENKILLDKIKAYIVQYNKYRDLSISNYDSILDIELLQKPCEVVFNEITDCNVSMLRIEIAITELKESLSLWDLSTKIQYGDFSLNEKIDNFKLKEFCFKYRINLDLIKNAENNIVEYRKTIIENDYSINLIIKKHNIALENYQLLLDRNIKGNEAVDTENEKISIHNNSQLIKQSEYDKIKLSINKLEVNSLPKYLEKLAELEVVKGKLDNFSIESQERNDAINANKISLERNKTKKELSISEYNTFLLYQKNNLIWKIYSKLIKTSFKEIIFEYYRTFLNSTLNTLLQDVDFKLFWNEESELYHIGYKNGVCTYQPVQQSSGMETCFLALALVYTIHTLNVKNTISHMFIDEISGTLNDGKDLSYDAKNYKEILVQLLNKFTNKSIFIIDHSIENLFQTVTYEVKTDERGSIFEKID